MAAAHSAEVTSLIEDPPCGVHAVMAGRTSENVIDLDILTYDGLRMTVGKTSDSEFERIVAAVDNVPLVWPTSH